jgi:hypothetical protein
MPMMATLSLIPVAILISLFGASHPGEGRDPGPLAVSISCMPDQVRHDDEKPIVMLNLSIFNG